MKHYNHYCSPQEEICEGDYEHFKRPSFYKNKNQKEDLPNKDQSQEIIEKLQLKIDLLEKENKELIKQGQMKDEIIQTLREELENVSKQLKLAQQEFNQLEIITQMKEKQHLENIDSKLHEQIQSNKELNIIITNLEARILEQNELIENYKDLLQKQDEQLKKYENENENNSKDEQDDEQEEKEKNVEPIPNKQVLLMVDQDVQTETNFNQQYYQYTHPCLNPFQNFRQDPVKYDRLNQIVIQPIVYYK